MGEPKAENRKWGFYFSHGSFLFYIIQLYIKGISVGFPLRALTLSSLEVRFHIDSETHDPIDLQAKELL